MTSQLNVDTIVDKAGSGGSNVKMANTSTYVSDGGATTQNTVQGLVKSWIQMTTDTTNDSFNVGSTTDHAQGQHSMNFSTNMANGNYCFGACGHDHTNDTRHIFGDGAAPSTSAFRVRATNNSNSDRDSSFESMSVTGDLA